MGQPITQTRSHGPLLRFSKLVQELTRIVIGLEEMTKIVQAILTRMDEENNDGNLTEEEFLKGCLQDD